MTRTGVGVQGAVSRRVLAAALLVIALLAAATVVGANVVRERRVEAAGVEASELAAALRQIDLNGVGARMLIGPGNLPRFDETSPWPLDSSAPLAGALQADEKVRLYEIDVAADPFRPWLAC